MSLNRKYTWKDFLDENPELKAKKVKRTSGEGKKAFEAAYKSRIKEILKDRLAWIEKEKTAVQQKRDSLTSEIKSSKKPARKHHIQAKIGAKDKYLSRLGNMSEKSK